MKTKSTVRAKSLMALASVLLIGATAGCTNTEGPPPTVDETGAVTNLGQGGQEAALAVTADPAIEALVPADIRERGVLNLVTDPTYAPIDFTDSSGNIIGLEPDLALAVANRMGLTIEITKADFNGILAGLESGRADASWAAFSITPERMEKVDMVSAYNSGTAVMVKNGNEDTVKDVLDLCGLTVAAQTGTTQALEVIPQFQTECSDAGKPEIKALLLPQQDSANQALTSGRADAMIADNALTAYFAQIQPDAFSEIESILVDPLSIGVAMPKGTLAEAFQAAIQSLMDDGTYGKIMAAWNLSGAAADKSEINPVARS